MAGDFLFFLFASLAVFSSLAVVLNQDPVNGAMFMILAFLGIAAIFVLLEAYFVAVLQVLVYAGAVMVLFLFIIMLLHRHSTVLFTTHRGTLFFGSLGLVLLLGGVGYLFYRPETIFTGDLQELTVSGLPDETNPMGFATQVKAFGYGLFTKYMLPLQVVGLLLLLAMMGVILLSKGGNIRDRAP